MSARNPQIRATLTKAGVFDIVVLIDGKPVKRTQCGLGQLGGVVQQLGVDIRLVEALGDATVHISTRAL